jgi:2'-hydroxyisoflavone reductase
VCGTNPHLVTAGTRPQPPQPADGPLRCLRATGSNATPVWADEAFPDMPDTVGFWAVSGASAKQAGLRTRPFADTVAATWNWLRAGGQVHAAPGSPPFGIADDKEHDVLAAWTARTAG